MLRMPKFHTILASSPDKELSISADKLREHGMKINLVHPLLGNDVVHLNGSDTAVSSDNDLVTEFGIISEDLLEAEFGQNDYDWLLPLPPTPMLETVHQNGAMGVESVDSFMTLSNLKLAEPRKITRTSLKPDAPKKSNGSSYSTRLGSLGPNHKLPSNNTLSITNNMYSSPKSSLNYISNSRSSSTPRGLSRPSATSSVSRHAPQLTTQWNRHSFRNDANSQILLASPRTSGAIPSPAKRPVAPQPPSNISRLYQNNSSAIPRLSLPNLRTGMSASFDFSSSDSPVRSFSQYGTPRLSRNSITSSYSPTTRKTDTHNVGGLRTPKSFLKQETSFKGLENATKFGIPAPSVEVLQSRTQGRQIKPVTPKSNKGRTVSKSVDMTLQDLDILQKRNGYEFPDSRIRTSAFLTSNHNTLHESSEFFTTSDLGDVQVAKSAWPTSNTDFLSLYEKDDNLNNWPSSPEFRDDYQQLIQDSKKEFGKPPSCPHGSAADTCELCSVKLRLQKLTEKCRTSLIVS